MLKRVVVGVLLLALFPARADEIAPTLDLKLEKPELLSIDGHEIEIAGHFVEDIDGVRSLAVGSKYGVKIPAPPLAGPNGTIAFSLKVEPPSPENALINRHLVTLRPQGRQFIGFYLLAANHKLTFAFKQTPESSSIPSQEDLEPGKWIRVACTWNGTTVKYYINGELQGEQAQPFIPVFTPETHFTLGPYRDRGIAAPLWNEDNCFLRDFKVWKRALSGPEIAREAGKTVEDVDKKYPPFLSVPRTSQPPVLDGVLDDVAWQNAASFVALTDASMPEESLSYKDNKPLFTHDENSLYIGFESVFPSGATLRKGSADDEEVWPNESFEFYLDIDGNLYRFAGNAAGALCQSRNSGSNFVGEWKYVSNLSYRIDNRWHWQGEIAIPFATVGLDKPIGKKLRGNFCRTWVIGDRMGLTSLANNTTRYGEKTNFATFKISDSGAALQTKDIKNPNFGDFENTIELHSSREGKFRYQVALVSSENAGAPRGLIEETIDCRAGESAERTFNKKISSPSYDRLLFNASDSQGRPLLQQLVPFKLSDDYLKVTPVFGKAQVLLKPRFSVLEENFGGLRPRVRVVGPEGQTIYEGDITSDDEIVVPFEPGNPAGVYQAELIAPDDGKTILTSKSFSYLGVAPWETVPNEEVEVLPPFEPIRTTWEENTFRAEFWGRSYSFEQSFFPTAINSQGQELLAEPITIQINDQEVAATEFEVTNITPGRIDFTASSTNSAYIIHTNSFLEYDGVLFNSVHIKAKKDLKELKLVIPLPESLAEFAHLTKDGFGAGGRINATLDHDRAFTFYPVVWVGQQERGLSVFAESSAEWKGMPAEPIRIFKKGNQTLLELIFTEKIAADTSLNLEFGLLATPVRPLPENYPLNTLDSPFAVHWNAAPPKAPVSYAVVASREGAGFFDLPLNEENPKIREWLDPLHESMRKNNAIFTPYMAALVMPEEYPEAKANLKEWERSPANHLLYHRDDKTFPWLAFCGASDARKAFAWRFAEMLKTIPLRGVYFDFGAAFQCSNALHGCRDRYPLMAMRDFYRRIAAAFVHAGVEDYMITVHNSETVQIPAFTHVTNLFNGEGLRQLSSPVLHQGKDILDTYTPLDFALEHSSLPWGITSSIYLPSDPLLPQFGGGEEDPELYVFRMTKAVLAGALVHNTMPSLQRSHHGFYNKIIRIYDEFGVPRSEFLPYWRNMNLVKVLRGQDIYVSLYQSKDKPEVLAVVSHLGKEHLNQEIELEFNPAEFGFSEFVEATEMLTAEDPEYARLYAEENRVRIPITLGDFGVSDCKLSGNSLKFRLDYHSVAIIKLNGKP